MSWGYEYEQIRRWNLLGLLQSVWYVVVIHCLQASSVHRGMSSSQERGLRKKVRQRGSRRGGRREGEEGGKERKEGRRGRRGGEEGGEERKEGGEE